MATLTARLDKLETLAKPKALLANESPIHKLPLGCSFYNFLAGQSQAAVALNDFVRNLKALNCQRNSRHGRRGRSGHPNQATN